MADPIPVVTDEDYRAPTTWRSSAVAPDWLTRAFEKLGWVFDGSELGELNLTFVDGRTAGAIPDPPIQLNGVEGVKSLPVLAYARIPADQLTFSRSSSLWLSVGVTQISDAWARHWANYVLQMGKPRPVPLGVGFANGAGAVIDTGTLFIRAMWGSTTLPGAGVERVDANGPAKQLLSLQRAGG